YVGNEGTLAYTTATAAWDEDDVWARSPNGALHQAPSRAWGEPSLSDDGATATRTGAAKTLNVGWDGTYAFAGSRLLASFPRHGQIRAIAPDSAQEPVVYQAGAYLPKLAFFPRADGKLLVGGDLLELVDPVTGAETELSRPPAGTPWP